MDTANAPGDPPTTARREPRRSVEPLQVTSGHKLWSLDRDGWVEAGQVKAGERLAGATGAVVAEGVTSTTQTAAVYNLDVESDHRYLVTDLGLLAHNATPCVVDIAPQNVQSIKRMSSADIGVGIYDVESGKVYMSTSSELGGDGHPGLLEKLFGEEATQALIDAEHGDNPGTKYRGFAVGKESDGSFNVVNNSSLNGTSLKMEPRFFAAIRSTLLAALKP